MVLPLPLVNAGSQKTNWSFSVRTYFFSSVISESGVDNFLRSSVETHLRLSANQSGETRLSQSSDKPENQSGLLLFRSGSVERSNPRNFTCTYQRHRGAFTLGLRAAAAAAAGHVPPDSHSLCHIQTYRYNCTLPLNMYLRNISRVCHDKRIRRTTRTVTVGHVHLPVGLDRGSAGPVSKRESERHLGASVTVRHRSSLAAK
ncbi:hypothetical protein F2P81_012928 [Scophthalmus maximus]|uniref:Uncharacterized protein n=1 Tax=Scophthalmus maximus TaxID=52904 RepID=A0A6A4STE2_SCOMX|nr:hypothetical protein F2P81_012928 [Scophthalmus maximus]